MPKMSHQSRAEQTDVEQRRTGQSRSGQSRPDWSRAELCSGDGLAPGLPYRLAISQPNCVTAELFAPDKVSFFTASKIGSPCWL